MDTLSLQLELWHYAALIGAGVVGGVINVMAGGGSVITVPMMVFLGVPGPIANGTNRIAILAQNLTAAATFWSAGKHNIALSLRLSACALPGAILGAWLGSGLSGEWFRWLLAGVMVLVLILMHGNGPSTQRVSNPVISQNRRRWGYLLMVAAGFWGGFIQIGMGFILMPILHRIMGYDLVTTNVQKVFITATYTAVALIIYSVNSDVLWLLGATLAIGNAAGGFIGAKLTLQGGETLIRRVMTIAIIIMVVRLLFFS